MITQSFSDAYYLSEEFIAVVGEILTALDKGHLDWCQRNLEELESRMELSLAFSQFDTELSISIN